MAYGYNPWQKAPPQTGQSYNPAQGPQNVGQQGNVGVNQDWGQQYDQYSTWNPGQDWLSQYGNDTYNITDERWLNSGEAAANNIRQNWWHNTNWNPMGGGSETSVYHPYYGWQPYEQVADFYRSAQGPVTWDQFTNTGWSPNMNFPGWYEGGAGGAGGGGSESGGGNVIDIAGIDPKEVDTSGVVGTDPNEWYGTEQGQMQYPWAWEQASGVLGPMSETGMPADWDPWYQQAKQVAQTDIQDQISQAAEQAGLSGLRWSTPLGRSAQDIAGRRMAELGQEWTSQQLGALENARGRQLQSTGQLAGLGQNYADYENMLAQGAYQTGQGLMGAEQGIYDKQMQEFMRLAAENNPWLSMLFQLGTGQGVAQQYQPSVITQMLGGAGAIAPLAGLCGGK